MAQLFLIKHLGGFAWGFQYIIQVFVFLQSCNTSEPDLCLIREDPMKTAIHKDASVTKVMMKQTNPC